MPLKRNGGVVYTMPPFLFGIHGNRCCTFTMHTAGGRPGHQTTPLHESPSVIETAKLRSQELHNTIS